MKKKQDDDKPSSYALLNRWLYDGSLKTELPSELIDDKLIPPTYLTYFFMSSKYIIYINEYFNNYSVYNLDKIDMFKFLKQCVLLSGYKPPYIEKEKIVKSQIEKKLKLKFPYLKINDIQLLVTEIDKSAECDIIYEQLGFRDVKKLKTTAIDRKKLNELKPVIEEIVTTTQFLENFTHE